MFGVVRCICQLLHLYKKILKYNLLKPCYFFFVLLVLDFSAQFSKSQIYCSLFFKCVLIFFLIIFFGCTFGQNVPTQTEDDDDQQFMSTFTTPRPSCDASNEGVRMSHKRYSIYFFCKRIHYAICFITRVVSVLYITEIRCWCCQFYYFFSVTSYFLYVSFMQLEPGIVHLTLNLALSLRI